MEKADNAGHQHFILFPQCFKKVSSLGSLKAGIVGKGLIHHLQILSNWSNPKLCRLVEFISFQTIPRQGKMFEFSNM